MNNQRVIDMLRKKFETHYGFEVEANKENEVDYTEIAKELKGLDIEMQEIKNNLQDKETQLEGKIREEGEIARKNAKNETELKWANDKLSKEFMQRRLVLLQDPEYAELRKQLKDLDSRYNDLTTQKKEFEKENAQIIEEMKKERIRKMIQEANILDKM